MTGALHDKANRIDKQYIALPPEELIYKLWNEEFPGKLCLASSFGAEAVVLLHYAAQIDKAFPIIFLDTLKLFPETLTYRDKVIEELGLTNVKTITPEEADIKRQDPDGTLWQSNPQLCCHIRKVLPINQALKGYDAWITGRKRHHGGIRVQLPFTEIADGRLKINPLAQWRQHDIDEFMTQHNLPKHPLTAEGYLSIGCAPCTALPKDKDNIRSGRWPGIEQEECGIHLDKDGKFYSSKNPEKS